MQQASEQGPGSERTAASAPARNKVCPDFHAAVELIGRRWSGAILYALTSGPMRFGELCSAVPEMSDRLLSERLKELQAEGLLERSVAAGSPPAVSYALTAKGAELQPAIAELRDWARRWKKRSGAL